MEYSLKEILNIPLLQSLLGKMNEIHAFPSAIANLNGEVLTAFEWHDVCTKFYLPHQLCNQECIKNGAAISGPIQKKCPHGLLHLSTPIIIKNKPLGSLFTGVFFHERPKPQMLKEQALACDFDEQLYLEAVMKIPVITPEKLHPFFGFMKEFIEIVADNGLKNLVEKEKDIHLQISENRNNVILQTAMDGYMLVDQAGYLLDVNETYCTMSGFSKTELLSMHISVLEANEDREAIKDRIQKIIVNGKDRFLTNHRRKDGSIYNAEVSIQFQPSHDSNFVVFVRDVTKQIQIKIESEDARIKALENEEKLKSIIESTDDFIWTVDPVNFGLQTFNSALYNYFLETEGLKIKIGDTPEVLVTTRINDWKQFYRLALEHGKFETEYKVVPKNRIFNLSLNRLVLDGKVLGISVFGRDITKLKQNEHELLKAKLAAEESEFHFRSIIENAQAGYFFIDKNGILCNSNQAWLDLYKYDTFDEVIGKHFTTVQQIDDVGAAIKLVDDIMKGDSAKMQGEFSRRCKDGSEGYHSFSSHPVFVNDEIIGLEGFIIDVTKLKETEKKLIDAKEIAEKNEQKYRSLFVSMQEGVYLHEMVYDNEGTPVNYRIIEANPISEKYLNIPREFAIGKLATDLFGTNEAPFLEIYAKVSQTGEPYSFEQYFEPMGKYFFISVFSPKKGEFATVFLNITQLKESEKELIAAKEQAEESDRLKTAFLQNMSHEIRTPMNAIMGFAELLPRNFNNKEKLERFSQVINQRCNDLLDIINDVLDIAKIESGQLPVNINHIKLSSVLSEIKLFFLEYQIKINKQNINFGINSDLNLDEISIETDKVKLMQVFINLISNAFKFTHEGKVEMGCFVNNRNQLIFFVSDTGIGIPVEKHTIIFDRFTQLDKGNTRLYGGTGLGLSIVKGLTHILGGKVWLESAPALGSTFFFYVDHGKYSRLLVSGNKVLETSIEYQFPGLKILIVEDDIYNADLIIELLTGKGFLMQWAINGRDAIQKSVEFSPHLILMDIGLPDITGYEAVHQILLNQPQMKIIAQTAYASSDDKNKALRMGCIDYISKPIKEQSLLTLLAKYLPVKIEALPPVVKPELGQ